MNLRFYLKHYIPEKYTKMFVYIYWTKKKRSKQNLSCSYKKTTFLVAGLMKEVNWCVVVFSFNCNATLSLFGIVRYSSLAHLCF